MIFFLNTKADIIMPYVKLQTNKSLSREGKLDLLRDLTSLISKELNKPEKYVMTIIQDSQIMLFGNAEDSAAYVEFRSISLPEDQTRSLSRTLSLFLKDQLMIPSERIFIQFVNAERHMWGYNATTF